MAEDETCGSLSGRRTRFAASVRPPMPPFLKTCRTVMPGTVRPNPKPLGPVAQVLELKVGDAQLGPGLLMLEGMR